MIHFVRSYWVEYNAYAGWWDELKRGWRERVGVGRREVWEERGRAMPSGVIPR